MDLLFFVYGILIAFLLVEVYFLKLKVNILQNTILNQEKKLNQEKTIIKG